MITKHLHFEQKLDFLLFGISSHVHDYRFCGMLNRVLKIDLTKTKDVQIDWSIENIEGGFSQYIYTEEDMRLEYKVLSNRGNISYLIPEQRGIDYFLSIRGAWEMVKNKEILHKLKQSDVVLMAYELDPKQLRSKQNLLFI